MTRSDIENILKGIGLARRISDNTVSYHKPYKRSAAKRSTFIQFKGSAIEIFTKEGEEKVILGRNGRYEIEADAIMELASKL